MKSVVITGIDACGKTTEISRLPWKNTIKYPRDDEIKDQINNFYQILYNNADLHDNTIRNIYRQIHDLYDRDFRIPVSVPEGLDLMIFDRYFIDNVVYSRINGVYRSNYAEDHQFIPDLVIMLKARNYKVWKDKFVLKGDENIREPVVLFEEVQKQMQYALKDLQESGKIKRYTIIEALTVDTGQKIIDIIESLLST